MLKYFLNKLYQKGYSISKVTPKKKVYKASSIYPHLTYHPTPIGNYYILKGAEKDIVAYFMKRGCFYDENVIKAAKRFIKPQTCVLDIGSNYGQMAIEFSKFVGENGVVYSFEAQKKIFDVLKLNTESNQCENIKLNYNAVYHENGLILNFPDPDLSVFGSYGSYGLNPKNNNGTAVTSVTIDSLTFELPISFMKIDIQGSDLFALKGAINTIKKHKMPIIIEFEQRFQEQFDTTFQDYIDFFQEINYKVVEIIEPCNFVLLPK